MRRLIDGFVRISPMTAPSAPFSSTRLGIGKARKPIGRTRIVPAARLDEPSARRMGTAEPARAGLNGIGAATTGVFQTLKLVL